MNAIKATTQSRYTIYTAQPARRARGNLIPHTVAIAAAFGFLSALIIGAI
ncbi:hypothetical protein [Sinorhizobium psoraleae]|uniref:Transmembrane protein n=1 Tax=Sinorhizobium psoraleae TaxID=520838 RepID=A0ABT4KKB8_9HYPH|nr:hypothetical protein [Sinorhizobium psoraleae]MCZ4091771.1 hypothetical protein [Sinorhizobium psoraleae]NRP70076.1 hypothetical protein [Sinorhizobium psoraleae]